MTECGACAPFSLLAAGQISRGSRAKQATHTASLSARHTGARRTRRWQTSQRAMITQREQKDKIRGASLRPRGDRGPKAGRIEFNFRKHRSRFNMPPSRTFTWTSETLEILNHSLTAFIQINRPSVCAHGRYKSSPPAQRQTAVSGDAPTSTLQRPTV